MVGDGHRRELRCGHESTGADHDHHEIHQPEVWSRDHLARFEINWRLTFLNFLTASGSPGFGQPTGRRGCKEECGDQNYDALSNAPADESSLISGAVNHIGDGRNGESGACAKTGSGES